jgi:sugar phosphate isomerase/epimerase
LEVRATDMQTSGLAGDNRLEMPPRLPRFSLAHLTVLGCAPPEATYIAARAGYDYVSYRIIYLGLPGEPNYALAHNPVMLRETKAALASTGLRAFDIELARIVDGVDVNSYAPALETAAELGIRHVISSIWTSNRAYAIDRFAALCDIAAGFGLTVNLEFVTWAGVGTLKDACEILHAVKRENCGLMIDTLHFSRSRERLEDLDAVPRHWFHLVHLCDAPREIPTSVDGLIHTAREARLDPGQGGIDLAGIVSRLPDVPYSLEIPNLDRVKEVGYSGHARLCVENAREYFAACGWDSGFAERNRLEKPAPR